MGRMITLVVGAALAAYAIHTLAQPRADLRPALAAIGTSSSNGISFAWFYDASERSVVVCRAGSAAGDALDCRARAVLP